MAGPPDKCANCKQPRAAHIVIYGHSMQLEICPAAVYAPTGGQWPTAAASTSSAASSSSPAADSSSSSPAPEVP